MFLQFFDLFQRLRLVEVIKISDCLSDDFSVGTKFLSAEPLLGNRRNLLGGGGSKSGEYGG